MNKRIFVNYQGGYCGSFLCGLIAQSIGADHSLDTDKELNIYFFSNKEIKTMYIKVFGKLFDIRKGLISEEELSSIESNDLDESYIYAKNLYNIVDDDDDDVFIENIKNYFKDLIADQRNECLVTSIHYAYQYKNLEIADVFPNSLVFHVVASSKSHGRFFHLLYHYKTKDDEADKVLQRGTLSTEQLNKDFIDVVYPIPFSDKSIPVDMGKLIFEKDHEQLSQVEKALSNYVGKEVRVDRDKFDQYADRNIEILSGILGKDFIQQSEEEQIKKSLDYIENVIRVK